jgi:dihydrofolate synthase/folylpolyglutamate synthase
VTAVEQTEAVDVVLAAAAAKKAPVYQLGRQFRTQSLPSRINEQVFHFHGPFRDIPHVTISLNGSYQVKNAAVALMALEVMRQYYALLVEDDVLDEALRLTEWPGRMELVSEQPRILLDGAHNPEGAAALAEAIPRVYRYERCHVLLGMLENKQHAAYLAHILTVADTLIVTEPDFRKKQSAAALAELVLRLASERAASGNGRPLELLVEPDWRNALAMLTARTGAADLAVVTGSLYLLADVRAERLQLERAEKGW